MPGTAETLPIAERIAALISQHRGQLEQLVDVELDRALDRLVAERLAARNGHGGDELCVRCGQRPRARYRRICEACHSADMRQRRRNRGAATPESASAGARADGAEEPPRPGDGEHDG